MQEFLLALLPDGISLGQALILVLSSALTSALTAGLGIGGGVLLLGIMAFLVPPAALIPLHGVVQIGSNVGRTWLMRQAIKPWVVLPFGVGAVMGAFAGGRIALTLPPAWLHITLGLFILYAVWGKWPALQGKAQQAGLWSGSVVISFMSMFVGATGPLVTTLLKSQALDRQAHVATFSACMSLQHGVKTLAFGFFGFSFSLWMPLLLCMIVSGFVGTWLGERWLADRSESSFHTGLNWLLTALAAQLLWQGLSAG
ncbi:MAG: sulfite exporter TauE/SafE family protein [Pseudomonadota bacterium]